jgi:hypothetical protein
MRKYLPFVVYSSGLVVLALAASFVARDPQTKPVTARELLAEPDYFHGRVIAVDTSKGWEVGDSRTLVFRNNMKAAPVLVVHVPPGVPDNPPRVRGLFTRGDGDNPHVIRPVP